MPPEKNKKPINIEALVDYLISIGMPKEAIEEYCLNLGYEIEFWADVRPVVEIVVQPIYSDLLGRFEVNAN